MKLVRLSALSTGLLYLPQNIPGTHFFQTLIQPQFRSTAWRIMSIKKKFPVTPPGIEPTTLRFVAQCVNQTRHSFTWNITQLIQCMHSRCLLIRQRQNGFTNHWKCLPFNPSQHKRKGRGASRRVASANSDMTNEIVSLCFKVAR